MDFRDKVIEEIQGWGAHEWILVLVGVSVFIMGVLLVSDNVSADGGEYVLSRMDCGFMANHDCHKNETISVRFYPETGYCGWICLPHRATTTTTLKVMVFDFPEYRWSTLTLRVREFGGIEWIQ